MIRPLLTAFPFVAAACFFLLRPDDSQQDPRADAEAGAAYGTPDRDRETEPPRTAQPGGDGTESSALPDPSADEPRAHATVWPTGRGPRGAAVDAADAVDRSSITAAVKMRRLGWDLADARAVFVSRWVDQKLAEDADFFDEIDRVSNVDRVEVMQRFNTATETRRMQLVQGVGAEAARAVADEWCLYRFDTAVGGWHRIDIRGERIPFRHADDDVWSNFEMSDQGWDNHRSR